MCSLQRNCDVIRNWERFETGPLTVYTEGYNESTEPIDATTMTTPPSTTPDIYTTNCAMETSLIKDVQEALILTTTGAVHVVCWFLFNGFENLDICICKYPRKSRECGKLCKENNVSSLMFYIIYLALISY